MLNWKRKRVWLPTLLLLAVILLGAAVSLSSQTGIERETARWRAEGLPATLEEWDLWYPAVPPDENAALLVLDAASLQVTPGGKKDPNMWDLGPVDQPLTDEQREIAAEYLKQNQLALKKLEEALQLPASRYPVKLWQGTNMRIDHLAPLKGLAQLLKWQALHHSAEGRREEAVRALRSSFALARTMRDEPVLITELVRIAVVSINLSAMQRVITEHQLEPSEIATLANDLFQAEADGLRTMHRAFVGERAYGSSMFRGGYQEFMALMGGPPPDLGKQLLGGTMFALYNASGLRHRDARNYLQTINGFIAATTNSFPEAMHRANEIETEFNQRTQQGLGRAAIFTRMLLPSLLKAVSKEATLAARLRCARAAMLVEEYRLKHGKLSDDVAALNFPDDPYTGEALRFERKERGYAVISPGATAVAGTTRNPTVGFEVAR